MHVRTYDKRWQAEYPSIDRDQVGMSQVEYPLPEFWSGGYIAVHDKRWQAEYPSTDRDQVGMSQVRPRSSWHFVLLSRSQVSKLASRTDRESTVEGARLQLREVSSPRWPSVSLGRTVLVRVRCVIGDQIVGSLRNVGPKSERRDSYFWRGPTLGGEPNFVDSGVLKLSCIPNKGIQNSLIV